MFKLMADIWAALLALLKVGRDLEPSNDNPEVEGEPTPRPGPPLTEADWSHGLPQPQDVDNPSGAIGGPFPKQEP